MFSFEVKGLLFDMDGTLVDSTAVVENEWKAFSARFGLDAQAVIRYAHGRQTQDTVTYFLGEGDRANAVSREIEDNEATFLDGIIAIPGAATLLASLPPTSWALVTSASRELAINRMNAAGLPLPAVMICAEDVATGKPSPDGFLKAACALGLAAEACVVFEDADAGLRAGLASGARVICVNEYAQDAPEAHGTAKLAEIRVIASDAGFTVSSAAG